MAKRAKGKAKAKAKGNGNGKRVKIKYKDLHREVERLRKKLKKVRDGLKKNGMATGRVDFVLQTLDDTDIGTRCQKTIIEEF